MKKFYDKEEEILIKNIENDIEEDNLKTIENLEENIKRYKEIAKNTLKKDKVVSFRISSKDLTGLQSRAIVEGMGYQTLISSIIHKYLDSKAG